MSAMIYTSNTASGQRRSHLIMTTEKEPTSRSACFRVREEYNALFAFLDQCLERNLTTVVCLDFTAKPLEVDLVAGFGYSRSSFGLWLGSRRRRRRNDWLRRSRFSDSLGLCVCFGRLCLALLLGRWCRSWRGRLALAELNHDCGNLVLSEEERRVRCKWKQRSSG